ncbi:MAG: Asp-tRNA(Asn)/Glu-tRNA(Gln) amidotransferase GatCAB subunit B, partial [Gemmatimonadales bacterium]
YRYFPEPDLPPLVLKADWLRKEHDALPELPAAKRARFASAYSISGTEAVVVTATSAVADHFESLAALLGAGSGKEAWNWEANDLLTHSEDGDSVPRLLTPERVAGVVAMVRTGSLSRQAAKKVLAEMITNPAAPAEIAAKLGLVQVQDSSQIEAWVAEVLAASPGEVQRYKSGETKLMGFLVGQVMKRSLGKADPKAASAALAKALG